MSQEEPPIITSEANKADSPENSGEKSIEELKSEIKKLTDRIKLLRNDGKGGEANAVRLKAAELKQDLQKILLPELINLSELYELCGQYAASTNKQELLEQIGKKAATDEVKMEMGEVGIIPGDFFDVNPDIKEKAVRTELRKDLLLVTQPERIPKESQKRERSSKDRENEGEARAANSSEGKKGKENSLQKEEFKQASRLIGKSYGAIKAINDGFIVVENPEEIKQKLNLFIDALNRKKNILNGKTVEANSELDDIIVQFEKNDGPMITFFYDLRKKIDDKQDGKVEEKVNLEDEYKANTELAENINTLEDLGAFINESKNIIKREGKKLLPYKGDRQNIFDPVNNAKDEVEAQLASFQSEFDRLKDKDDDEKEKAYSDFVHKHITIGEKTKLITSGNDIRNVAKRIFTNRVKEVFEYELPLTGKISKDTRLPEDLPKSEGSEKNTDIRFELQKRMIFGDPAEDKFIDFALTKNPEELQQEIDTVGENLKRVRKLSTYSALAMGIDKKTLIRMHEAAVEMLTLIKEYVEAKEDEKPLKELLIIEKKIDLRREKLQAATVNIQAQTESFNAAVAELEQKA